MRVSDSSRWSGTDTSSSTSVSLPVARRPVTSHVSSTDPAAVGTTARARSASSPVATATIAHSLWWTPEVGHHRPSLGRPPRARGGQSAGDDRPGIRTPQLLTRPLPEQRGQSEGETADEDGTEEPEEPEEPETAVAFMPTSTNPAYVSG
ncbi:hypothetical protein GCM10010300_53560 [Streptomyces olivaceoviridis]|uniref:hypothetical protein n=1 Tax=Streptomyces olivaceoviridis TaxID=1921 RepID=UPI001677DC52|nr:hypothetical protein [Streptomyces olivaceoviridis]GGZ02865.1 hypothetical protein GCM10010300_53560 [Streptomyces olivaceoviridis]